MFDRFKRAAKTHSSPQYIVCGLGNPGLKYEHTRHNVGFLALDFIAAKSDVKVKKLRFKSLCNDANIAGKRVLLIKPSTFMNNSGEAVRDAAAFYKIPPEHTIIIFDDVSLTPGKIRIRMNGSDGGHNGMKSIIYLTGKDTFPRIKIGIGDRPHPNYDLADWVLSNLNKEDFAAIEAQMDNIFNAVSLIIDDKADEAMNKYNS